jgi:hypothetical protein
MFEYVNGDDPARVVGSIVNGCMEHAEGRVLNTILHHEEFDRLSIVGPYESSGWETLREAMPAAFPCPELRLAGVDLNVFTGKLLFDILAKMPKLDTLHLCMVHATNSVREFDGEALKQIKTLDVIADDYSDSDVLPLLFKILENCDLEHLRIEEKGGGNEIAKDRRPLKEALHRQTKLNSLSLTNVEKFDCYRPLLGSKVLSELKLIHSNIAILHCNEFLETLENSNLHTLSMRSCVLGDRSNSERAAKIWLAAGARNLRYLDFSRNWLGDDAIALLLTALKEKKTRVVSLKLEINNIGQRSVEALASLLEDNETLQSVSFLSNTPDACEVQPLVEALKHNKVLRQLDINFGGEDEQFEILEGFRHTVRNGMRVILSNKQFPEELALHIYEQGLTRSDVLNVSSVSRKARGWE